MNSIIETDDWKLGCFMEWRPKHRSVDCPSCGGRGVVGGHFKDIDGERPCGECFGTGHVSKRPTSQKPELPPALVEHMRRAWWDFVNKKNQQEGHHG